MREGQFPWKQSAVYFRQQLAFRWPRSWRGGRFMLAFVSTTRFSRREECSSAGFLLAFLAPLLLLLCAFLLGSLRIALLSQKKIALQSRLDVCAVKVAVEREKVFSKLAESNGKLMATAWGIYAARGVKVFGGPVGSALGSASETVLLQSNRILAAFQKALLIASRIPPGCSPTLFSKELAFCMSTPITWNARRALFPDVNEGVKIAHENPLAQIQCRGTTRDLNTKLEVHGDPQLLKKEFFDVYRQQ